MQFILVFVFFLFSSLAQAQILTVDSNLDEVDLIPGDGICAAASGCTLRAAVMEGNAAGTPYEIDLPAGTFTFTLLGDDDVANVGDLDLQTPVTISGAGADQTIIDANNLDRVFEVHATGSDIVLENFTAINGVGETGAQTDGGSFLRDNDNADSITLTSLLVKQNSLRGLLISNASSTVIDSCVFLENDSSSSQELFHFDTSSVTITNSIIAENTSTLDERLFVFLNADATLNNNTIVNNDTGFGAVFQTNAGVNLNLGNNILLGNPNTCEVLGGGVTSLGGNIEDQDNCALAATADQVSTDAGLAALNETRFALPYYPLTVTSAAFDGGNSANCETDDMRGIERPQSSECDSGSFEARLPTATPDVSSLSFSEENVGDTSAEQSVTISNTGDFDLSLTGLSIEGPFAATTTCDTTLAIDTTCSIQITYTASQSGSQTGTATLTHAQGSTVINLTGSGAAAPATITTQYQGSSAFGCTLSTSTTQSHFGYLLMLFSVIPLIIKRKSLDL